jgi:hypothetical protein
VTTKTSTDSSVTIVALRDELLKIAMSEESKRKLKNFAKSTATIAAGTGAGYGTAMLADKAFQKMLGHKWENLGSSQKKKLLGAGLGLTLAGSYVARSWLDKERKEANK